VKQFKQSLRLFKIFKMIPFGKLHILYFEKDNPLIALLIILNIKT